MVRVEGYSAADMEMEGQKRWGGFGFRADSPFDSVRFDSSSFVG